MADPVIADPDRAGGSPLARPQELNRMLPLVDPKSGEHRGEIPASALIGPEAEELLKLIPTPELGQWLRGARDFESELRAAKSKVADEVHSRMDGDAKWTITVPGVVKLEGESPNRVEYDGDALKKVLDRAVRDGVISKAARAEAIERVVTHKPRKRGLNALLALGGELAEKIKACGHEPEKSRSLRVKAL